MPPVAPRLRLNYWFYLIAAMIGLSLLFRLGLRPLVAARLDPSAVDWSAVARRAPGEITRIVVTNSAMALLLVGWSRRKESASIEVTRVGAVRWAAIGLMGIVCLALVVWLAHP